MSNFKNFALWVIIALLLVALFNLFQSPIQQASSSDIDFSRLLSEVDSGNIRDVTIAGDNISGHYTNGGSFHTYAPTDPTLVNRLYDKGVQIKAKPTDENVPTFLGILINWFPMLLLVGVWVFFMRQMQGGGGKAMGFGKSKAKLLTERHGRVTFDDVAGIDEAKDDLTEIVDFLR
ncbi:MAG TPA: ATP-dependent metallopeptidase FtsH/Yme1/Tma family protein, partial [Parvibaculum sp.]